MRREKLHERREAACDTFYQSVQFLLLNHKYLRTYNQATMQENSILDTIKWICLFSKQCFLPLSRSQKNSLHFRFRKLGKLNVGLNGTTKPVSDFFTSCAVMDKKRIHATMWLFMELSSRPAIRLPLMDNGLLMEKVINDKRRLLAATVQSSWCYTTLDLSLHLPGAIWCSLARSLWESSSLLPPRPASGGDEPWRRTRASSPLLNFGIRL